MPSATGYLLDTSVLIELLRGKAAGARIDSEYGLRADLARNLICVISVGEVYAMAKWLNWGAARIAQLDTLLNELVWLDIRSKGVLEAYAEIALHCRQSGRPIGQNDMWIASVARASGTTLLTTDRDFDTLNNVLIDRIWIDPKADTAP